MTVYKASISKSKHFIIFNNPFKHDKMTKIQGFIKKESTKIRKFVLMMLRLIATKKAFSLSHSINFKRNRKDLTENSNNFT